MDQAEMTVQRFCSLREFARMHYRRHVARASLRSVMPFRKALLLNSIDDCEVVNRPAGACLVYRKLKVKLSVTCPTALAMSFCSKRAENQNAEANRTSRSAREQECKRCLQHAAKFSKVAPSWKANSLRFGIENIFRRVRAERRKLLINHGLLPVCSAVRLDNRAESNIFIATDQPDLSI